MKKSKVIYSTIIALLLSLLTQIVLAHDGSNVPIGGFLVGLIHPVLGNDHLLAMLSVGILSAQIGGKAIWTVPATFVGVMAVGGVLGFTDLNLTFTEIGIAASLIILGLLIAAERRLPVLIAMIGVGFFAVFHGYAHGTEMPEAAQPVLYALGFLTGTIVIHVAGVIIGDISRHYKKGATILRFGGGFIALIGVLFVTGIV